MKLDEQISLCNPQTDRDMKLRDLSNGSVLNTPSSQFKGPGFNPWSGN